MSNDDPDLQLRRLRQDIDRIDLAMHESLMERGEIIHRLIGVKARQGGGSAFRPGREASMMRALAERHRGLLPLDTVEGIWRIIIATFTYVQAGYSLHADVASGDAATRDSARFHFGFTVPFVSHNGPQAVIDAVKASAGDLGLLRLDSGPVFGAWWRGLAAPEAPKIIARIPFVERPDHPAGLPAFIISKPLAEAAATEVAVKEIMLDRWRESITLALAELGVDTLGSAAAGNGLSLLVAAPGDLTEGRLSAVLRKAGSGDIRIGHVGTHAARFEAPPRPTAA